MTISRIDAGARLSEAVIHGNTVYLTGQVGEIGSTVGEQTAQALAEIDALLAKAGTDKSRLIFATIWLADIADFDSMNEAWEIWVDRANPPARATSEAKLADPGYLVEIIAIAAVA